MSRLKWLKGPEVYYNNGNQGCTVSCSLLRKVVFSLSLSLYITMSYHVTVTFFLVTGLQSMQVSRNVMDQAIF